MGVKPGLGGECGIMDVTAFNENISVLIKAEGRVIIKQLSGGVVHAAVVVHVGAEFGACAFTSEVVDLAVADDDVAAVVKFESMLSAFGVDDHVFKDDVFHILKFKDGNTSL